ncbi:MAG: sigma-54-dependent Fis family transcriptional regulator, partial [Deltaproteobacteria bacterium]|nr:sigma-54-dependent Fis family transcriptional regulator [Deltaproteobacteria bacterium]
MAMRSRRFPKHPVIIVDDEEHALQSFEVVLRSGGIDNFLLCQDSQTVMPLLAKQSIEVMLLDLWMPHMSGEEILSMTLKEFPDVPVIIVTGVNEVDTAVKCMRIGAFDYLVKPVDKERLLSSVKRAIELRELRRENALLKDRFLSVEVNNPEAFSAILTSNDKMKALFRYVEAIAGTSQSVLITGETGVGKE